MCVLQSHIFMINKHFFFFRLNYYFLKQKRYMPDRTLTTWKGLMKIYFTQDTYFLSTPCRSLEIKLHRIHVHIQGKSALLIRKTNI